MQHPQRQHESEEGHPDDVIAIDARHDGILARPA
jgi:hypothetical protein